MDCLDRFNKKMKLSGGSLRNENIKNSQELLQETFDDDASLTMGIYFWEHGIKSYEKKQPIRIRLYDRKFSNAVGSTVKFQTLINTPVVVGDIIYNSKADEYYICTEVFNIDNIHWQGKFTMCNWILKWQNKKGKILEYPCYDINSTQYNSGETTGRQGLLTVGSSQHMITLPCDENTIVLSTPQRFYLDKNTQNPTSFIVSQNDTTSYNYGKKGLVKITLMEHPEDSEADRPDLGICDYIDVEKIRTNNSDNHLFSKAVIHYNTKIIKSGGDSQVFEGKFYNDVGKQITDIVPKWDVVCDFFDELNIEKVDNRITIGIDNDDYVDEEFKLILSDTDNYYSSTLIVKIESLL